MSVPASPPPRATTASEAAAHPANWSGVLAMSLCVFALIASEFMPVSLLTPIATTLDVSEGWVGYGIAISGAFAVVTSLLTARAAGRMDRKVLLLLLTVLMCVSGVVVAAAANYAMYLLGRALIGVVIGAFWSMSAAVAIRLVPTDEVPKALALFNGGNALATVVAAPLGSYLGGVIGWRGAFFCIVPVAVIALAWQWRALPSMRPAPQATVRPGALRLLTRGCPRSACSLPACSSWVSSRCSPMCGPSWKAPPASICARCPASCWPSAWPAWSARCWWDACSGAARTRY